MLSDKLKNKLLNMDVKEFTIQLTLDKKLEDILVYNYPSIMFSKRPDYLIGCRSLWLATQQPQWCYDNSYIDILISYNIKWLCIHAPKLIFDTNPDLVMLDNLEWIIRNRVEWLMENYPDLAIQHRLQWIATNRPDWLFEYDPEILIEHNYSYLYLNKNSWFMANCPALFNGSKLLSIHDIEKYTHDELVDIFSTDRDYLFEYFKQYLIKHRPYFIFEYDPEILIEQRPIWIAKNKPFWCLENGYTELVIKENATWMAENRTRTLFIHNSDLCFLLNKEWILENEPEWLKENYPLWKDSNKRKLPYFEFKKESIIEKLIDKIFNTLEKIL